MKSRSFHNRKPKNENETLVQSLTQMFNTNLPRLETLRAKTALAESISPLVKQILGRNVKFSDLYDLSTSPKGWPMISIFPWNTNGQYAASVPSLINAFVDVFGYHKYVRVQRDDHIRWFNPNDLTVLSVRSRRLESGTWIGYQWADRGFVENTPYGIHHTRWVEKHREINLLIAALQGNFRYDVVLFTDRLQERFQRNIQERLEGTLSEGLEAQNADWTLSKVAQGIRRSGRNNGDVNLDKPVMIGDVDLRNIPGVVMLKITGNFPGAPTAEMEFDTSKSEDMAAIVTSIDSGAQIELA